MTDTADPLAGSYAIEHLTTEIEARANDYLKKIDAMVHAARIETGYVQREIQNQLTVISEPSNLRKRSLLV